MNWNHTALQPQPFSRARTGLALMLGAALLAASIPATTRAQASPDLLESAPPPASRRSLDSVFSAYEILDVDPARLQSDLKASGRISLRLAGLDRQLELEPHDLRAQFYRETMTTEAGEVELPRAPVSTFRGTVAGEDGSEVRLLVADNVVSGYVRTADDWLFVDPASRYDEGSGPGRLVVYREADVRAEHRGDCGAAALERQGRELLGQPDGRDAPDSLGIATEPMRFVEIATDADFQFFKKHELDSNNYILGIINQVDGIYRTEVNIAFTVTFQHVWTRRRDPYTFTNADGALTQFTDHWNAVRGNVHRDVAHLFTGWPLDGNVIGQAWINRVCNDPLGSYGISQDVPTAQLVKLVAHELGHNFGCFHDDQQFPGDPQICPGAGQTLMCAFINARGANMFSQSSKDVILNHVRANSGCLDVIHDDAEIYTTDGFGRMSQIAGYSNWRKSWSIIVPGNFGGDGNIDLLFYDPSVGHAEFFTTNGAGGMRQLRLHTNLRTSWDMIIPGNFGGDGRTDLFFYDRESGTGQFYATDGAGGIVHLSTYTTMAPGWDIIIPGNFGGLPATDLLFYDRESGHGQFYMTDGAGGLQHLASHFEWSGGWDLIVPGSFGGNGWTDLLFYDRETGFGSFWTSDGAGRVAEIAAHTGWNTSWDMILPGDFGGDGWTDLLFYDREAGLGSFWTTDGRGRIAEINAHGDWRTSWSLIVPAPFGGDTRTDLLFYQR